jgi:hypothetical protein
MCVGIAATPLKQNEITKHCGYLSGSRCDVQTAISPYSCQAAPMHARILAIALIKPHQVTRLEFKHALDAPWLVARKSVAIGADYLSCTPPRGCDSEWG